MVEAAGAVIVIGLGRRGSKRHIDAAGLAMAFKLLLAAERTWRRLNGHQLLPLVAAGVIFRDGVRVEREDLTNLHGSSAVDASPP